MTKNDFGKSESHPYQYYLSVSLQVSDIKCTSPFLAMNSLKSIFAHIFPFLYCQYIPSHEPGDCRLDLQVVSKCTERLPSVEQQESQQ